MFSNIYIYIYLFIYFLFYIAIYIIIYIFVYFYSFIYFLCMYATERYFDSIYAKKRKAPTMEPTPLKTSAAYKSCTSQFGIPE